MSDQVELIPLAHAPQSSQSEKAQVDADPLGLSIEAAEIAGLPNDNVRQTALNAFESELMQMPNWEEAINAVKVAQAMKPYEELPIVSCGTSLKVKADEKFATSLIQAAQIQDPAIDKAEQKLLIDTVHNAQKTAKTDPAMKAELKLFEERLLTLKSCNKTDAQFNTQ